MDNMTDNTDNVNNINEYTNGDIANREPWETGSFSPAPDETQSGGIRFTPYYDNPPVIPGVPAPPPAQFTGQPETPLTTDRVQPQPPRFVYSRPAPVPPQTQTIYTEPRFSPAVQPSRPSYTPGFSAVPAAPKEKKKKHTGGFIILAVCLCLICTSLGTAAGVLGARYEMKYGAGANLTSTVIHAETKDSPLKGVTSDDPQLQEAIRKLIAESAANNGDVTIPADILYLVAVNQIVAITTSIEYTSRFSGTGVDTYSGTGFILTSDGLIITNYHVISEGLRAGVDIVITLYNNETYLAECRGYDEDNDIAVLKIDANGLNAVTIGKSESLRVGERVYAIGNPRQLNFTMTEGIISAVDRSVDIESQGIINMFQIDAAVNPGNSGGPVYNSRGEVVGIVSAKYMDSGIEGLGFAIPIDDAIYIADSIIEYGYVKGKPMLGVTGETVDATQARYYGMIPGYYIYSVEPGSAADKAGIKARDTIVELGGMEITSVESLTAAKSHFKAGETTTIKVYRQFADEGEYITANITFDEYAAVKS